MADLDVVISKLCAMAKSGHDRGDRDSTTQLKLFAADIRAMTEEQILARITDERSSPGPFYLQNLHLLTHEINQRVIEGEKKMGV